jgi:hypothetical protein
MFAIAGSNLTHRSLAAAAPLRTRRQPHESDWINRFSPFTDKTVSAESSTDTRTALPRTTSCATSPGSTDPMTAMAHRAFSARNRANSSRSASLSVPWHCSV